MIASGFSIFKAETLFAMCLF